MNKQIKSLVSQLAAFDNIDVDSYNRLKARYEVLNQNLEIIKEENKTLKLNLNNLKDENIKTRSDLETELENLEKELQDLKTIYEETKVSNDNLITSNTELKVKLEELEKLRNKKVVLETMIRNLEKRIMTDEIKFKQDSERLEFELRDTKNKNDR